MSIPSWDELRTQAQQISSRRAEQESSNLSNELLAKGLSGAFTSLFPEVEKKTFSGQLSSTTGEYTPFQTPYTTGGSGLQQLINRGRQSPVTEGNVPIPQDLGTQFVLARALAKGKEEPVDIIDPVTNKPTGQKVPKGSIFGKTQSEGKDFQTANQLRKEFIDRPEVKEFVTVNTQVKSMDALLKSALSGNMKNQAALDQGLITMYNKLTDPNSVVRESEYARTPENLPTINRIIGAIQKVKEGGAGLTNEDRQALVLGARIIGNERGKEFRRSKESYTSLSGKYGIDPSLVVGTLPDFSGYATEIAIPGTEITSPNTGLDSKASEFLRSNNQQDTPANRKWAIEKGYAK